MPSFIQKYIHPLWHAKNTDTFKPMGPYIVTDLNPDDLQFSITLNGRQVYADSHLERYFWGSALSEPYEPVPHVVSRRCGLDGH